LILDNIKLILPQEVPSSTPTESKLTEIRLAGNNLSSPKIFKHLSVFGQLEEIYLMNNNFTVFDNIDTISNDFPKLKRLGLASNEPSLCGWIKDNEEFLKNISVWGSTSEDACRSADFKPDVTMSRN